MILSILLCLTFFLLGLIHFNWAVGGTFGFENSLPTKENGERVLNPKKIDSAIVGVFLTCFGLFYLLQSNILPWSLPFWIQKHLGWIIPGIFLLRAVGDFKYVGFFKKVKNTNFSKVDTKFFTPLCLAIAFLGLVIYFLK